MGQPWQWYGNDSTGHNSTSYGNNNFRLSAPTATAVVNAVASLLSSLLSISASASSSPAIIDTLLAALSSAISASSHHYPHPLRHHHAASSSSSSFSSFCTRPGCVIPEPHLCSVVPVYPPLIYTRYISFSSTPLSPSSPLPPASSISSSSSLSSSSYRRLHPPRCRPCLRLLRLSSRPPR